MKLTDKEMNAIHEIGKGMSGAQFSAIHPTTRRSLFAKGLIGKDWNHKHSMPGAGIEYLRLTEEGMEASGANEF